MVKVKTIEFKDGLDEYFINGEFVCKIDNRNCILLAKAILNHLNIIFSKMSIISEDYYCDETFTYEWKERLIIDNKDIDVSIGLDICDLLDIYDVEYLFEYERMDNNELL